MTLITAVTKLSVVTLGWQMSNLHAPQHQTVNPMRAKPGSLAPGMRPGAASGGRKKEMEGGRRTGRRDRFGIQLHLLAPNQCLLGGMLTKVTQSQRGHGKVTEARLCKCQRGRSAQRYVGAQEKGSPARERREVCFPEEVVLEEPQSGRAGTPEERIARAEARK